MDIGIFSCKPYDREFFQHANKQFQFRLQFFEFRLAADTVKSIRHMDVACVFVNDDLDQVCMQGLKQAGVKLVALRCAGFNNVDLLAAKELGITVVRVPAYSPQAVAEHTLALILCLNRKIHKAYARVREGNFSLHGLLGFNLQGKNIGVIGTGKIGSALAKILIGLGMRVLAYDVQQNPDCVAGGVEYMELEDLYRQSHIISLHCPLNHQTHHLISQAAIDLMRPGVMLINTSRGAVIDTGAVVMGLKSGKIGYLALDVYEQEADLFFEDLSCQIIQDDMFERLLSFPNVLITGHQGFFTREALEQIAHTTLNNVQEFLRGSAVNQVEGQGGQQCVTHNW